MGGCVCVSVLERGFVRVEVEEESCCWWCCCCPPSICVCVCVPAAAAEAVEVEPCVCVGGYVDVVVGVPFTLTRRIGPAPPAAEGPLPPCMMVVCGCVLVDGGTPPPAAPAPPRPLGLLMTRLCACSQGLRGEARVCVCVCGRVGVVVLEGCAVEGAAEEGGWRLEGKGAMNGLGCVCVCVSPCWCVCIVCFCMWVCV